MGRFSPGCLLADNLPAGTPIHIMATVEKNLSDLLRTSLWTRSLTPAQLARVEAETLVRDLPVGVPVCRKGEPVEHWIGLIDGLVKMTSVTPEGRTTTFTGVTSGGWFGEGSLLKDRIRKYDVVTLRESRVAYMPRATSNGCWTPTSASTASCSCS